MTTVLEVIPPFAPELVEEPGMGWYYRDGRVLGAVDFIDIPTGGRALTISEWSSEWRDRGHSVEALQWLRTQFQVITANGVGTLDEDGAGDIATYYWAHMVRKGLVDVLLDDDGHELVVGQDDVAMKGGPVPVGWRAMTRESDSVVLSNPCVELESLPIDRRLTHYANSGMARELEALMKLAPEHPALYEVHKDLDGTMRWHVIDRCVLMVNSGESFSEPAANFARCAELLRPYPIGHVHLSHGAVAQSLLDTAWHVAPAALVVEALLRECLVDGSLDVTQRLPRSGTPMSELLPLAASFVEGNVLATRAIVDHIMTLDAPEEHLLAPLEGTGFRDVLEYARSFGRPGCGAVASVMAEALMKLRLAQSSAPSVAATPRKSRARL